MNMAKKWINVIPIVEDARHTMVGMVDVIFANIMQSDQAHIVAMNTHNFLKNGGYFIISMRANGIALTVSIVVVFALEVTKLQKRVVQACGANFLSRLSQTMVVLLAVTNYC